MRKGGSKRLDNHGEFIFGGICLKGIQEEDHRKIANQRERERMKQLGDGFQRYIRVSQNSLLFITLI